MLMRLMMISAHSCSFSKYSSVRRPVAGDSDPGDMTTWWIELVHYFVLELLHEDLVD
jgi:hypothetical protein